MTDVEFDTIVAYMRDKSGIDLSRKRVMVEGKLDNYLLRSGLESYGQYIERLETDIAGKETESLMNILTTNHTYFMREFAHFEYLKREVLPSLKRQEERSKDLRVWSAASSTGEEPYTLAMLLCDFFGLEHAQWDTTVLATDISTKVLSYAQKGVYLKEQIEPLPEKWKTRYFKKINGEEYQAKPELKKEVLFRQFNLMNPFPFKRKFHIVFLRNVMIYFDEETKARLLQKIYDFMEPGGYLFIGTTESIRKERTRFRYLEPSIYRK